MAQSAVACSPIRVSFFWDKGPLPELDLEKRLSFVKLAIMIKDNIKLDNLLRPKPESEELAEPHLGLALPDEATAERR